MQFVLYIFRILLIVHIRAVCRVTKGQLSINIHFTCNKYKSHHFIHAFERKANDAQLVQISYIIYIKLKRFAKSIALSLDLNVIFHRLAARLDGGNLIKKSSHIRHFHSNARRMST